MHRSRLIIRLLVCAILLLTLSCKLIQETQPSAILPPGSGTPRQPATTYPEPPPRPRPTHTPPDNSVIASPAPLDPQSLVSRYFKLLGQVGGNTYAVATQAGRAYIGIGPRLAVLDMTAPGGPALLGQSDPLPGVVRGVAVRGDFAYVAAGKGHLHVLDISDSNWLYDVGSLDAFQWAMSVVLQDDRLYIADNAQGLWIAGLEKPDAPVLLGSLQLKTAAAGLAVQGATVFVADMGGGLTAIDASDPAQPRQLGRLELPQGSAAVAVSGSAAFVAAGTGGLWVVDISDPAQMRKMAELKTLWADGLLLDGSRLYLTDMTQGVLVVDVSSPQAPKQVGSAPMMLISQQVPGQRHLALDGPRLLIANPNQGLTALDVSQPNQPRPSAGFDIPLAGTAFDVIAEAGQALVTRDFIGLGLVDASTPSDLAFLGSETSFVHGGEIRTSWKLDVQGGPAYLADVNLGLRTVARANPAKPTEAARLKLPGSVRSVLLHESLALVTTIEHDPGADPEARRSLRIIDLSTNQPREIGMLKMQHDASALALQGNLVYYPDMLEIKEVAEGAQSALHVIDISSPTAPVEVGRVDTTAACPSATAIAIYEGYAYLSGDQQHGLCIFDLAAPTQPVFAGFFDEAIYILDLSLTGQRLFGAAYAQVVAIDLADPAHPRLEDQFVTPGLAWGIFARPEQVFVADMDGGLVLLGYR